MTQPALESLTFDGPHGPVNAHLARPSGRGPFAAVLVLQEGLGVTQHLLRLAQRFADAGYLAFVPNLYSHEPAHQQLTEAEVLRYLPVVRADDREAKIAALPAAEQASARKAAAWFTTRRPETYFPDTLAAVQFLKRHSAVRPDAIASVGFSLGGGLSAQLAAAGAELAAGVIFYGQGPADAKLVRYPLLGHYAENDPGVNAKLPELTQQLKAAGKPFSAHVYPGTQHGFFSDSRPVYVREAAELAHSRTLAFFAEHLGRTAAQEQSASAAP